MFKENLNKATCLSSFLIALLLSHGSLAYTTASGEVLQDPTRPANTKATTQTVSKKAKPKTSYTLNYIIKSGDKTRAMINGIKVHEGHYVQGAKVKEINQDSVLLLVEGKPKRLYVNRVRGITKN